MQDEDAAAVLLSDSEETPPAFDDTPPAATAARKRGRPRGSTTRVHHVTAGNGGGAGKAPRLAGVAEMATLLSKLIGGASVLLAFGLVGAQDADTVAMTAQEASAIAQPAARLLSKSRWARQTAALAAKSSDVIDLTLALGAYLMRVYPLIALHQAQRGAAKHVNMGTPQPIRTDASAAAANAAGATEAANATAGPTAYGGPAPSYLTPFLGLSDADANQFAAWGAGDMAAAVRAATGN